MRILRMAALAAIAGCSSSVDFESVTSAVEAGAPPTPVYQRMRADDVTGDNTPVIVPGGGAGGCSGSARCYIADPGADSYSEDQFERPAGQGSLASTFVPSLDITSGQTGITTDWLYYRVNLFGPQTGQAVGAAGSLPHHYGIEINVDADDMGDAIIDVTNPSGNVGINWGTTGIEVKHDANETMGGPRPLLPDGPGDAGGGYEKKVFDQGQNSMSDQPGGSTAVQARINGTSVELAVYRPFLEGLSTTPIQGIGFRPYSDSGQVSTSQLYTHDDKNRTGVGSPYPWLTSMGAPAACPSGNAGDDNFTAAQIAALETGTNVNTGIVNPCYATGGIYLRDNAGTVAELARREDLQVRVDVSLTKTDAVDPVSPGSPIVYTLTATNLSTGTVTGVTITDPLPANVTFVSATGGCTYVVLTHTVTCAIGNLLPSASASRSITVTAPNSNTTVMNTATVSSDGTDTNAANNTDTESTVVNQQCGNGMVESPEVCDDGNASESPCANTCLLANGQQCTGDNQCNSGHCDQNGSGTCEPANQCGNGTIEPANGEVCDDGNTTGGDGCEASCKLPNGANCTSDNQCDSGECDETGSMTCVPNGTCGNGIVDAGEVCDDGNATQTPCASDCRLADGQMCSMDNQCHSGVCDETGSMTCVPANACGNNVVEAGEVCDDGNASETPCTNTCRRANGQPCTMDNQCASGVCDEQGSHTCEPANTCGNGNVEGAEGCDDGNTNSGDGCNSGCRIEDGFPCTDDMMCASGQCDPTHVCNGTDTDGDGVFDFEDIDDDNDGVRDVDEPNDTDGDLALDSIDLDSDNDGIADATESGHRFPDRDGNFIIDCPSGAYGANGFCNALETVVDNGIADYNGDGSPDDRMVDTDADGVPDAHDLDSDNDSLADAHEGGSGCADSNNDAICDGNDSDRDGIPSSVEVVGATSGFGTLNAKSPVDTDNDGAPNYRDKDSDGDSVFDILESKNFALEGDTKDGVIDDLGDEDKDGVRDVADDSDLDGVSDKDDADISKFGGLHDARVDTDGDGDDDSVDEDSDDDEIGDDRDNCRVDVNGDQIDSDGDGFGDECDADDSRSWGISGGCGCGTTGDASSSLPLALGVLWMVTSRRRRRRLGAAALAAAAILFVPFVGHAQVVEGEFGTERFQLATDRDGIIDIESGSVRRHLRFDMALWMGYENDPLVLQRTDVERTEVGSLVADQISGEMVGSLGLWNRLQLGLAVPLVLMQSDNLSGGTATMPTAPQGSFALGDLRLIPKVKLLTQGAFGVDLALWAAFTVPSSSGDGFAGDTNVTFAPALALSRRFDTGMRFGANAGWRTREKRTSLDLEVNDELFAGVGLGYDFATRGGPPVGVDAAFSLATAANDAFGAFNRNYAEVKLGTTIDIPGPASGFVAGGFGVAEGYGTPDWRALAGVRVDTNKQEEPAPPPIPDTDGDGYKDDVDGCKLEPEDFDKFEDENGCPDTDDDKDGILDPADKCRLDPEDLDKFEDEDGCPETDNDKDGLLDTVDKCPIEPEDLDKFQDDDGCPDPDNDQDTVLDAQDECPEIAGPVENKGCPWPDRDGDGVIDKFDNCPTWKGTPENNGCASKQLVKITESKLELYDTTYFATNKTTIQKRSFRMLDQVAMVLKAHTELKIEIEGHTDDRGSNASNLKLSQGRADSVKNYLLKKGVDASRLSSTGYGEDRPIDTNKTAKGRAKNRRVEFMATRIIETTTTTTIVPAGPTAPATPGQPTTGTAPAQPAPAQPAQPAKPTPAKPAKPELEKP
jgi:uncharacterized repeat protein (TIGR01451 family)/MYXO-CTERM domain-containing protein